MIEVLTGLVIMMLSVEMGKIRSREKYRKKLKELKDNDEKMLDYIHNHFEL